tara:strand:+ start:13991 stop:15355 length:1365 start_codon:yes stop_codon:yes gene_type:complete
MDIWNCITADPEQIAMCSAATRSSPSMIRYVCQLKGSGMIQYATCALKSDRAFVREIVKTGGRALAHIPLFQDDDDIVGTAVAANGMMLCHASSRLVSLRKIVVAACRQDGRSIIWANPIFRDDFEVMMLSIQTWPRGIEFASRELRCNEQLVRKALCLDGGTLKYVDHQFRSRHDLVSMAISSNGAALQYASTTLQDDERLVKSAAYLKFASERLRNTLKFDKKAIIKALSQGENILNFIGSYFNDDIDIINIGIQYHTQGLLKWAHETIQNTESLAFLCVSYEGRALEHIGVSLRHNLRIALRAVRSDPHALQFVPTDLPNYRNVVLQAMDTKIATNVTALRHTTIEMRSDVVIIKRALDSARGWANGVQSIMCAAAPTIHTNKFIAFRIITQHKQAAHKYIDAITHRSVVNAMSDMQNIKCLNLRPVLRNDDIQRTVYIFVGIQWLEDMQQ